MGNTFYFEWEIQLLLRLQEHAGHLGADIAKKRFPVWAFSIAGQAIISPHLGG